MMDHYHCEIQAAYYMSMLPCNHRLLAVLLACCCPCMQLQITPGLKFIPGLELAWYGASAQQTCTCFLSPMSCLAGCLCFLWLGRNLCLNCFSFSSAQNPQELVHNTVYSVDLDLVLLSMTISTNMPCLLACPKMHSNMLNNLAGD